MNAVTLTVSIPATVLSCQVAGDSTVATGPSPDVPELQALHHYAGQWEDEIAGKPGKRRTETAEWILQGRFLRQSWTSEGEDNLPPASGLTLYTFDPALQRYRSWAFLATGSVIENEGAWDAASQTFSWSHPVSDTADTVITTASFVDEQTQTWSIVKIDAQGKILREVAGRSLRRTPPLLHAA